MAGHWRCAYLLHLIFLGSRGLRAFQLQPQPRLSVGRWGSAVAYHRPVCATTTTPFMPACPHPYPSWSRKCGAPTMAMTMAASAINVPMETQGDGAVKTDLLHRRIKVGKFSVTLIGIWMALWTYGMAGIFYPALFISACYGWVFDSKRMRLVDWVIRIWAVFTMKGLGYRARIIGEENLPPLEEAVMYIPNHTSFLDILTLTGMINRPFKYISKVEVLSIPFIGWAMLLAKHVAIRRASKASQLQMISTAVKRLKFGSSLVTFAEGTRSKTGRLLTFKKGPFRITKEAGVRIVPVSICNLSKWMPPRHLVPIGVPDDVVVVIHPPVETVGRPETEVSKEVFQAINSGLPDAQKHVPFMVGSG